MHCVITTQFYQKHRQLSKLMVLNIVQCRKLGLTSYLPNKSAIESVQISKNSNVRPKVRYKIIRKNCNDDKKFGDKNVESRTLVTDKSQPSFDNNSILYTPSNIQLIPNELHRQIFIDSPRNTQYETNLIEKCHSHLQKHSLWGQNVPPIPSVNFKLPELEGLSINDHFQNIAKQQTFVYKNLLDDLITKGIPLMPQSWVQQVGWTKYIQGQPPISVPYPDSDALVFDIETCVPNGPTPVIATAASSSAWYSWCSQSLIDGVDRRPNEQLGLADLIPLETELNDDGRSGRKEYKEKIVVGHNVSFDRSRVKEQYFLQETKLRFIDTMSLHIAVSGITSFQRVLKMTMKDGLQALSTSKREELLASGSLEWNDISSLNNLKDVHKLYCEGEEEVHKEIRNIFVHGNITEIKADFQNLMTYCAKDVKATHEIITKIFPLFYERFPHPVTLAGMLEMGMPYLPINSNWNKYISSSEETFTKLENEIKSMLMQKADDALKLLDGEKYKADPWLWDLDWKTPKVRKKKIVKAKKKSEDAEVVEDLNSASLTPKKTQEGFPAWYRKLFYKPSEEGYNSGPAKISTSMQIIPKLLHLCWFGFPLHYSKEGGWGFLVKKSEEQFDTTAAAGNEGLSSNEADYQIYESEGEENDKVAAADLKEFPFEQWEKIWETNKNRLVHRLNELKNPSSTTSSRAIESAKSQLHCKSEEAIQEIDDFLKGLDSINNLGLRKVKIKGKAKKQLQISTDCSPHPKCEFRPLPHKDGANYRVGNPLAKDFLNKMEDGILTSESGEDVANKLVRLSKMVSYWRNNKDRILGQITVWMNNFKEAEFGAILPQVSVAGTLTRRAVEKTWLTASNAYVDRVGSELKGMIQAPPGYHFVGADVDSQELWIASILGDAGFTGFHGSTALGWMTLQGNKNDGTDMHSKTASLIGIGRDQAKILNYGRIYGAGVTFAERLLQQFNRDLSPTDAKEKATTMYKMTKGERKYLLNEEGKEFAKSMPQFSQNLHKPFTKEELRQLMKALHYPPIGYMELVNKTIWDGGTESEMFNRLEEIAQMDCPTTPILHCCISRSLVPSMVQNDFMTSRVNWVVQSSAVDYLHIMLTCMRWLIQKYQIKARFSISVHDEVRYLVESEDRYRAALALQITNLLTRALCSAQLGMNDLPQAVAFFSCVDVDKVLRKEVTQDCKTPSNPHGLRQGYNIGEGEALDIHKILEITEGLLELNRSKKKVDDIGTSANYIKTEQHQQAQKNPYAPYI